MTAVAFGRHPLSLPLALGAIDLLIRRSYLSLPHRVVPGWWRPCQFVPLEEVAYVDRS
jgi:hypothetical protein